MARGERSSRLPLLILIGLLLGGGYNYHRNLQAETAAPRPYQGYSESDLKTLLGAYQTENAALESRYAASRGRALRNDRPSLLDENIHAFERTQRSAEGSRAIGAQLSMQQSAAAEIEAELARRAAEPEGMALHLKRLLTL